MPKCPVCDEWMKKSKARETMPIKGGMAAFDVTCWKCSKCGEEAYDEKQYSQVTKQVQNVVQQMSQGLIQKAQRIHVEFKLHFINPKEKEHLLSTSVA